MLASGFSRPVEMRQYCESGNSALRPTTIAQPVCKRMICVLV